MIEGQEDDEHEDHEVVVKHEENRRMIEAPLALQAARGFCHGPQGDDEDGPLPARTVKPLNVREACEPEAGEEGDKGQQHGAHERALTQAEDGEEGKHDHF